MPATIITKTIKPSGGDYTTLTAWEAAMQGDIVAANEQHVAVCSTFIGGLQDTFIIDGWTTDSTRYIEITSASDSFHDGTRHSGFYVWKSANFSRVIRIYEAYTRLTRIEVVNTHTSFNAIGITMNTGWVNFNGLIVTSGGICIDSLRGNSFIRNCVLSGYIGIATTSSDTNYFIQNNAIDAVSTGISIGASNTFVEVSNNVVIQAATASYLGTVDSGDTNAAYDASSTTPPGTSPLLTDVVAANDFNDAAAGDFRLKTGSILIDAGTDRSGDASPFDVDALGITPWPGTWDIGAFSFEAAAAATPIYRLINGVWVDVNFTGTRLIAGVWVTGQLVAAAGPQSITLGQAVETNTATSLIPSTAVQGTVTQAVETDTAAALTPAQDVSGVITQAVETNTADILVPVVAVSAVLAQVVEIDTAQIISGSSDVSGVVTQAQDTETAITLAPLTAVSAIITQAVETDTAITLAPLTAVSAIITQAVETDTAITLAPLTAVSAILTQAVETDTARVLSGTSDVVAEIGQAVETQSALVLYFPTELGQAAETDTSNVLSGNTNVSAVLGQVSETDTGLPFTGVIAITGMLNQASGSETAQALVAVTAIVGTLNQSAEIETAQSITPITNVSGILGTAAETNTSISLFPIHAIQLIQAVETDTATAAVPFTTSAGTIGQASESDSAAGFTSATISSTATVLSIVGGANLTDLSYCVFAGYDISTATLIKQGVGETTDGSGNLVIDLNGTGVANSDPLTIIITNYTDAPNLSSSRGAVCFTTADVA